MHELDDNMIDVVADVGANFYCAATTLPCSMQWLLLTLSKLSVFTNEVINRFRVLLWL